MNTVVAAGRSCARFFQCKPHKCTSSFQHRAFLMWHNSCPWTHWTAAASPDASGSTQAAPPAKPSFADMVAGRTTPEQTVSVLISEVQRLTMEVSQARACGTRTYDQLQQEKQSSAERLEHLHRHSKRNNLVVFGVPESMALNTPTALACHMQGLLFQQPQVLS